MKLFCLLAGLVFIGFLTGCSTMEIDTDWDSKVDFTNFKSYSWVPGPQPHTGNVRLDNDITDSRIRAAIDNTLAAKGYQKVGTENPDFWVSYHTSIEGKLDVETFPSVYAMPMTTAGGGLAMTWNSWSDTYVTQYDEGTIVVDVADARTKRLIWRGSVSDVIDPDRSPAKKELTINRAVEKVLAKFPPYQPQATVGK